jgi:hypothetical protein
MVKQQLVSYSYTCDVCGGTISDGDSATRRLSWEGTAYVVDVCDSHASLLGELLTQLRSFVDAGTRVSGRRGRRPAAVTTSTSRAPRGRGAVAAGTTAKRGDLSAVRAWARENGHQVSERGRIPGGLLAAYDAANSGPASTPAPAAAPESAPAESSSQPATAAASRAPRGRRASASTSKSGTAPKRGDLSAVRAWARENGLKVSERGRIPGDLLAAYDAANNGGAAAPAPAARKRRPRKVAPAAG